MKKSKSIIFLVVWYTWAAGKDLDGIVRHNVLSDYFIFSSNGLIPLFFILAFGVFILNTGAVYSLFKPHAHALSVCYLALVAALLQNVVSVLLALKNLESIKEAYLISRQARGLTVREGAADVIFSTQGMLLTLAIMCVFYLIVGLLVAKNRKYLKHRGGEVAA